MRSSTRCRRERGPRPAVAARLDLGHPLPRGEGLGGGHRSDTAATMSTSLAVSRKRRTLPAASQRRRRRTGRARPRPDRPSTRPGDGARGAAAAPSPSASPARIVASVFSPRPESPRMRPAFSRLAHVVDASADRARRRSGGRSWADALQPHHLHGPRGLRSTSRSSAAIWPVASSSATLSAIVGRRPPGRSAATRPRAARPTRRSRAASARPGGTRAPGRPPLPRAPAGRPSGQSVCNGRVGERRGFHGANDRVAACSTGS